MQGGRGGAPCLQKTLEEAAKLFFEEETPRLKARFVARLKDSFKERLAAEGLRERDIDTK